MWPYYKLLPDLPRPPQKFFDEVEVDVNNLPNQTDMHEIRYRNVTRGNEKFLASPAVRVPTTPEFAQWFKENIAPNPKDVSINYRHCNSDTGGIHTDTTREYRLAYNILDGGPNCGVIYYQQDGYPLMRELAIQHLTYHDVTPVHKLVGPNNVWFLMDTRILHSCEGIESPRVQFDISFDTESVPQEWLVD